MTPPPAPTVGPRAILFDLDDTLLVNPMGTFVPAYFRALTEYMADELEPGRLINQLLIATRAMDDDDDPARTNEQVFADAFFPALGFERSVLEPRFASFYREAFPALRELTRPVAGAFEAVRWAFDSGRDVVLATNPVFPRDAIRQRLEWALPGSDELPFDLITSYEEMHSTKARPDYYLEIAGQLARRPSECVMVGDNWKWDIVNSVRAGMAAWWIAARDAGVCDPDLPLLGRGSLEDFVAFARREWTVGGEKEMVDSG